MSPLIIDDRNTDASDFAGILHGGQSLPTAPLVQPEEPIGQWPFKYQMSEKQSAFIDAAFTYHKPHGDQAERYQTIRNAMRATATLLCLNCPESAELTLALRKLQEASVWANASIAINEHE